MSQKEPERIFIATGRLKKALSLANLLSTTMPIQSYILVRIRNWILKQTHILPYNNAKGFSTV